MNSATITEMTTTTTTTTMTTYKSTPTTTSTTTLRTSLRATSTITSLTTSIKIQVHQSVLPWAAPSSSWTRRARFKDSKLNGGKRREGEELARFPFIFNWKLKQLLTHLNLTIFLQNISECFLLYFFSLRYFFWEKTPLHPFLLTMLGGGGGLDVFTDEKTVTTSRIE